MLLCTEIDSEIIVQSHDSTIMIRKIENASLVVTINKNYNTKTNIFINCKIF